jgi:hypothetical protein
MSCYTLRARAYARAACAPLERPPLDVAMRRAGANRMGWLRELRCASSALRSRAQPLSLADPMATVMACEGSLCVALCRADVNGWSRRFGGGGRRVGLAACGLRPSLPRGAIDASRASGSIPRLQRLDAGVSRFPPIRPPYPCDVMKRPARRAKRGPLTPVGCGAGAPRPPARSLCIDFFSKKSGKSSKKTDTKTRRRKRSET